MTNQPPPDPYGQGNQPSDEPQYPSQGQPGYPPPGYGPPGQPGYPAPAAAGATNTMAVLALVLALAGLVTWISAPVGAILGHVARKQIRERGEQGDGMALTGIIVGWAITALGILGCCAIVGLVAVAESA